MSKKNYKVSTKIGYSVDIMFLLLLIYNIKTLALQFHWEFKFIALDR